MIPHFLDFSEMAQGLNIDIMVVDVANPDSGEAMPIPHARAAWPQCKILAITSGYAFRSSAFYQMGLWSPDQLLLKPINLRILTATVSFLWAQVRTERIRRMITASHNCELIYDAPFGDASQTLSETAAE
jgi:DNA-binding response OmpR family regulator